MYFSLQIVYRVAGGGGFIILLPLQKPTQICTTLLTRVDAVQQNYNVARAATIIVV